MPHTPCFALSYNLSCHISDAPDKLITPILCTARRPPDSPSKHVSFEEANEKENELDPLECDIAIRRQQEANLFILKERERNNTEYQRRKELRERLEKAKERASRLRAVEIETKMKTNNILLVR